MIPARRCHWCHEAILRCASAWHDCHGWIHVAGAIHNCRIGGVIREAEPERLSGSDAA